MAKTRSQMKFKELRKIINHLEKKLEELSKLKVDDDLIMDIHFGLEEIIELYDE